jgi:hypothetical protein
MKTYILTTDYGARFRYESHLGIDSLKPGEWVKGYPVADISNQPHWYLSDRIVEFKVVGNE